MRVKEEEEEEEDEEEEEEEEEEEKEEEELEERGQKETKHKRTVTNNRTIRTEIKKGKEWNRTKTYDRSEALCRPTSCLLKPYFYQSGVDRESQGCN